MCVCLRERGHIQAVCVPTHTCVNGCACTYAGARHHTFICVFTHTHTHTHDTHACTLCSFVSFAKHTHVTWGDLVCSARSTFLKSGLTTTLQQRRPPPSPPQTLNTNTLTVASCSPPPPPPQEEVSRCGAGVSSFWFPDTVSRSALPWRSLPIRRHPLISL